MKKTILLKFDQVSQNLVGYELGQQTYLSQIKRQMDFENGITIKFPDDIQKVSSSFIHGLCHELLETIGIHRVEALIEFKTFDDKLSTTIKSNLY